MTIFDAHVHWWRLAHGDYAWLTPAAGPLYRDFDADDYLPVARRAGVDRYLLVQAADTAAETTRLIAAVAARPGDERPRPVGVVGWADFDAPDFATRILEAARPAPLLGLRPMLQDLADDAWCAAPGRDEAFAATARAGLGFDALVKPRHYAALVRRMHRTPELRVVIDHAGKPDVRHWKPGEREFVAWRDFLRETARHPAAACKWSGLLTEAAPGADGETLRPYADAVYEAFGTGRILFGSDWPVLVAAADYDHWLRATRTAFAGLSASETLELFGGAAERFYRTGPAEGVVRRGR